MSDKSGIEWTDATWNTVTGCTKVSPGCDHCYAETLAERFRGVPGHPFTAGFDLTLRPNRLELPLGWREPRMVFVNSMSDLMHGDVPDEFVARTFAVMALAARHTFQLLTKRHARLRSLLSHPWFHLAVAQAATTVINRGRYRFDLTGWTPVDAGRLWVPPWPLPNVWVGVSVESQQWADLRVPALVATPAAVRFISAEPLLGYVDLSPWLGLRLTENAEWQPADDQPAELDWLIVGGESGPGARQLDDRWVADLVDQGQAAGVAVFVKQLGTVWGRRHGADRKAGDPAYWPQHLRVRQFPG